MPLVIFITPTINFTMASMYSLISRIVILFLVSITSISCRHERRRGAVGNAGSRTRAPSGRSGLPFLVFGDSLADYGNNNYLLTEARADAPPYGIDFPTGRPTGRFSNGLNLPDIIAEELGLPTVLPYLSPELTGYKLLDGANFASAGIGILNETGIQFFNIIRIWCQLENFEKYQERVAELMGEKRAKKLVSEAVVLITLGGNDFVNNYFLLPYPKITRQYGLPAYVKYLISEYAKVLMRLYELGCRRILVPGTGPMGCAPAIMASQSRDGKCVAEMQQASELFNQHLAQMVTSLNLKVGSLVFITADVHLMHMDMFTAPEAYGFVSSTTACCGQGPYNGIGLCTRRSNLCSDRNLYLFWDAFHPCEKATRLMVQKMVGASSEFMHPMNLSTLLALDSPAYSHL